MPDTTTIPPTATIVSPTGTAPVRVGYGYTCPACDLTTGRLSSAAEATQLADIHDHLHHGGAATAVVLGGTDGVQGVCESCGRAPAVLVWDYPPAGAPFALCTGCAPTTAFGVPAQRGRGDVGGGR